MPNQSNFMKAIRNAIGILVLMFIAFSTLYAQENDTEEEPLSLDMQGCIDYALKNSANVQNATLDERIALGLMRERIGTGLPQVTGSVQIIENLELQRLYSSYSSSPGGGGLLPPGLNMAPGFENLKDGDIVALENLFQLRSFADAKISVTQLVFSASYILGLKAAKTYKDLIHKNSLLTKEQVVEQVSKAYYGVLISRERLFLFESNIQRVDSLLQNTKALYKLGAVEQIDVQRIQVNLNNLKTEKRKFESFNILSSEILKHQLNMPIYDKLIIEGNISDFEIQDFYPTETEESADYFNRMDFQVLLVQKELAILDKKNKLAETLPTLSAFGNFGYSTQSPSFAGLFRTETNITPPDNSIGPDKWYSYSLIGLNLDIPIFAGFQGSHRIQQARLEVDKIENIINQTRNSINLDVSRSRKDLNNSINTVKVQQENMALAENVAKITKAKYEEGVGSNIEVIDAESSLKEAQLNYYTALYETFISKIEFDKATGRLINN